MKVSCLAVISEKLSKEFQKVIQEELGVELSLADAQLCLSDWTNFFNLLAEIEGREKSLLQVK